MAYCHNKIVAGASGSAIFLRSHLLRDGLRESYRTRRSDARCKDRRVFNSEISDPRRRLKLWISAMRACYWGIAIRKSQSAFIGDSAPPRSRQNRKVMERFHNSSGTPSKLRSEVSKPQKRESPAIARLSCKSWRETRDSNPGNAINVRRFSRLPT